MKCHDIMTGTGRTGCYLEINTMPKRTVFCNIKDIAYFKSICAKSISVIPNIGMSPGCFFAAPDCKPQYNLKMGWVGHSPFEPPPATNELIRIE